MKLLWAPWRIEYITGEKEQGCIFCRKPGEGNDKKNLILYNGQTSFIIMNRYPYANGHLMAVPYRHTSNLSDLRRGRETRAHEPYDKMYGNTEGALARRVQHRHEPRQDRRGRDRRPPSFSRRPRWSGDNNFMAVIADVRVMPEYLEDTYEKLSRQLNTLER